MRVIHFPFSRKQLDRPDEPGDDGFGLGGALRVTWVAPFAGHDIQGTAEAAYFWQTGQ
jgi:hypothetical protein